MECATPIVCSAIASWLKVKRDLLFNATYSKSTELPDECSDQAAVAHEGGEAVSVWDLFCPVTEAMEEVGVRCVRIAMMIAQAPCLHHRGGV